MKNKTLAKNLWRCRYCLGYGGDFIACTHRHP